jgi:protein-L-isoaspartate(D-aspartate) O-methyltransferase
VSMQEQWRARRERMVLQDLQARGIRDTRVLAAMRAVPRHEFVPPGMREHAYEDRPLPIGEGQTISQPYMVARMTEALGLGGQERVLEIGTGSGYQTAVLAELAGSVWTVERSQILSRAAREVLERLGTKNVRFLVGDGTEGWPSESPFDGVLATGSLPGLPDRLLSQLAEGGRFVGPIGSYEIQELVRIHKHAGENRVERLTGCRFVPLVGREGWREGPPALGEKGAEG